MKNLIAAVLLTLAAASAHAAGCLVFDATAPTKLDDGSVVYPISKTFPEVVPIKSCSAGAGSLIDSTIFIAVDISKSCHPIKVNNVSAAARDAVIERLSTPLRERVKETMANAPARYTTAGLYTDGKGKCGPLSIAAKVASTKAADWTNY